VRIKSPSLPEIHAFAATARLGGFTRAADELCVTQGAVSRSVARLEMHLGVKLLSRLGRQVQLTEAGRAYLDAVVPALQTLESAAVAVMTRQRTAAALRLSIPPTFLSQWLIPRLPNFQEAHPGLALSFAPYKRDDLLAGSEIDAWVRIGTGRWPNGIVGHCITGRELVPICHPRELKGVQAIRSPADVLQRPLLAHTHYPDDWKRWCESLRLTGSQVCPRADFELVGLLVQAVGAGMGVALVQRCLIEGDLAAGRVAIAVQRPIEIDRGYYLCHSVRQDGNAALRTFRQWLVDRASMGER
jgi:LysR family glycine cleavage system transcriptional activator